MKNLLDYIYNEPFRVLSMLGINLDAFQSLTAQVEKAQNTHQNEQEAEKIRINAKGAGRPPKLKSRRVHGPLFVLSAPKPNV